MTDKTVYLYNIHCIVENIDVTLWSDSIPTLCPNDHIDRTINHIRIIKSLSSKTVISEEPSTGNFQAIHEQIIVPSGTAGAITIHDLSYPIDILIWKTEFIPTADMIGDKFNVIVDPDKVYGILTTNANTNDTILNVNQTVIDNINKGYNVTITDGINTDDVGVVLNIDKINNTITVQTALTNNFLAATPTYIKVNYIIIKNLIITQAGVKLDFGNKGFRAQTLHANIVLRIEYTNNDGLAKSWPFKLETYMQ